MMDDHLARLRENMYKQHAELVKTKGKEYADQMLEQAIKIFTQILLGGIEYTDPRSNYKDINNSINLNPPSND